jgi:hypothetical protein
MVAQQIIVLHATLLADTSHASARDSTDFVASAIQYPEPNTSLHIKTFSYSTLIYIPNNFIIPTQQHAIGIAIPTLTQQPKTPTSLPVQRRSIS